MLFPDRSTISRPKGCGLERATHRCRCRAGTEARRGPQDQVVVARRAAYVLVQTSSHAVGSKDSTQFGSQDSRQTRGWNSAAIDLSAQERRTLVPDSRVQKYNVMNRTAVSAGRFSGRARNRLFRSIERRSGVQNARRAVGSRTVQAGRVAVFSGAHWAAYWFPLA